MTLTDNRPVDTAIEVTPLQPTIGAEISGVDLHQPLTPEVRDAIKAAVLRHKVVFFRDQFISREEQVAFASQFGPLYDHPDATRPDDRFPAVHNIAARDAKLYETLKALVQAPRDDDFFDGYHIDTAWRLVPTWGAVLRPVDLPEVGGDTIWVDAALAYEGLPDDVKERLVGLHIAHDYRASLNRVGADYPIVAHPVVKVHRETGQKILYADFTKRPVIIGLDRAENNALLELILDQYRKPEYQVRFSWKPGSLAFWDNRGAVHYAVRNYGDYPRLLERVLIAEERLYADL